MGHRRPIPIELQKNDFAPLDVIVDDAIRRIDELRRTIVIAINGSSIDVGKSAVSGALNRKLTEKGIPVGIASDIGTCRIAVEQLEFSRRMLSSSTPGILLLQAAAQGASASSFKKLDTLVALYNHSLQELCGVAGIDLWIGIQRPDRPFSYKHPVADYLIQNTGATDKGRWK